MADDYTIRYADEMLNEIPEMVGIMSELMVCQTYVQRFSANLDDAYEGEASSSLHEFYLALNAHLTSLQMFYSVALEHMLNCFLEIHGLDELMAGGYL